MAVDQGTGSAEATGGAAEPAPASPWRRARPWLAALLAVVVVLAGLTGFLFGRAREVDELPDEPDFGEFVTFSSPATGFRLSHPKAWTRVDPGGTEADLILSAGGENSMLVRVLAMEVPVDASNLVEAKAISDRFVDAQKVDIRQQQQISLNGMLGYYYLYVFSDPGTGQQGAHAHYFLFQGRKLNILVFQALPVSDFSRLAPAFDRIATSFQSDPNVPDLGPLATTTTAAPPTTVP